MYGGTFRRGPKSSCLPSEDMHDIEIHMRNEPGQLALMGETLGATGISIEGGGIWVVQGVGVGHFLVEDGPRAQRALEDVGMTVVSCREVITHRLDQAMPGQLGKLCRTLADAGVNVDVLYSDHNGRLIVIVDDSAPSPDEGENVRRDRGP